MAGFGLLPFGTGPYGFGTPTTGAAPPVGAAGSRYINPVTRDYQIDPATGQQAQMPPLRQRVLLAVMTVLRSSTALPGMGINLPKKMGTTYEVETQNAVLLAVRQMTDVEKVMRVDRIDVKRTGTGRSEITISYTDLTTGEQDRVTARG